MNLKVQNKNILPIDYNKYTTSGTYGYYKLTNIEEDLIISISDKDTSVSMTGIFFGFSGAGADNSSGTQWIMSNGTQISTTLSNLYTSSGTTTKLKYFSFYPNNSTTFNKIFSRYNIQVEKGTATPYVAHEEQNLPFTLSSGQKIMEGGYLASDGIYNVRNQITLDGTENWARSDTNQSGSYRFATNAINSVVKKPSTTSEVVELLCNRLIKKSAVDTYSCIDGISISTNGSIYIYIDDFKTYTVEQFKTWLSNNNLVLEFPITTPTTTAYNSTQQSQYNAIQQAYSYTKQTNISSTSTDLSADLEVEAVTYSSSDDYTENEMQIGTWLGKPLYRKVKICGELPNLRN